LSLLSPPEKVVLPESARILPPAPPPNPQAHPCPPPAPAVPVRPGPAKVEGKAWSSQPKSFDFRTVQLRLAGLLKNFDILHAALSEPLTVLRDLDAAIVQLEKVVQAVKWLGPKYVPAFVRAADHAQTLEEGLAARAALVHLGAPGAVEKMMSMLEVTAAERQPLATAGTILRTLASTAVLDGMLKLFFKPADEALGSLLLPILAEQGALSSVQLLKLSQHPKDALAIPAAEALAWVGDPGHASFLLASARKSVTSVRANALLFASVALGSTDALAEVRSQIEDRAVGDHHLVEALAIAGDDTDAPRLIALIEKSGIDADQLLLAAANLGLVDTVLTMPARVRRETLA
jgi:hypothetical protein